jgi:hypothetical protein
MSNDTRIISQWTHGRLGAATRETPRATADDGQGKVTKPRMTQAQRDHLRENASVFAPTVQETIHLLDDADRLARFCREAEEIFAGQRPGSTRDLVYDLLGRDPV